tara:strand:+ start:16353 stop:18383 length:2031 start_codon:yes stop_codon:yes gene_type:complete
LANLLAKETSPYLLQHANNPVDWHPWGDEAFKKAKGLDRPVFLSVGYSSCHWCHVMERESFEDPTVAEILNREFVAIKVDREERPEIDAIYMSSVVSMTGQGGWPMSVFLTPDGLPFYGGTYYPPVPRHGMPSFTQVLDALSGAYRERRQEVTDAGKALLQRIETGFALPSEGQLAEGTIVEAGNSIVSASDLENGGWGSQPKFPQPMLIHFLLNRYVASGDDVALKVAEGALQKMARGGIYDQIGGGFHRYSVDAFWLTPHFEKMLYDNSQLVRVYVKAWQITGNLIYRKVAEETLDYVMREMTLLDGGFSSTQDADSEGVEGKFFLWDKGEIHEALGEAAEDFARTFNVSTEGNFEGQNILNRIRPTTIQDEGGDSDSAQELSGFDDARKKLFEIRSTRIRPATDDKVITSWNGLMMAAFSEAAIAFDRSDYWHVAEKNANFIVANMRNNDGRLLHTWRNGRASVNGLLEDYSYLIEGLLCLYQGKFDEKWFVIARELADVICDRFYSHEGGFFDTSDDHEELITRPMFLQDNAVPSGGAMAATTLLKIADLTGEYRYREMAESALKSVSNQLDRYPTGHGQWLIALDYAIANPVAVALVGKFKAKEMQDLLAELRNQYRPHCVVACGLGSNSAVPLLKGRDVLNSQPTAYVCRDFVCSLPVTELHDLRNQLMD